MGQFVVQTGEFGSSRGALIWIEASVLIAQLAIIALTFTAYPLWRLLPRVGVSKYWAILAAFPPAAIILIWVAGFKPLAGKD